ncbi:cold-shock protein [Nocardia nova]|uniref:cold-shock protein n=1 Tax=Nocardia nova TaxID=37330 RepID=UPI0027E352DE|nr:cold shock domain-containing protein [Nocardia nova]
MRFDEVKGYGFITPDDGGEDIFVHVNDLRIDKLLVKSGLCVEFEVEEGDRGKIARNVHPMGEGELKYRAVVSGNHVDMISTSRRVPLTVFLRECTEMIIESAPGVSGEDIARIRQGLVGIADKHGWVGR